MIKPITGILFLFLLVACNASNEQVSDTKEISTVEINLDGQVFLLSNANRENDCDFSIACDCCSGKIGFSENKFIGLTDCINGNTYTSGFYTIEDSSVILSFAPTYYRRETEWRSEYDTTFNGRDHSLFKINQVLEEKRLSLYQCGNELRVRFEGDKWNYIGKKAEMQFDELRILLLKEGVSRIRKGRYTRSVGELFEVRHRFNREEGLYCRLNQQLFEKVKLMDSLVVHETERGLDGEVIWRFKAIETGEVDIDVQTFYKDGEGEYNHDFKTYFYEIK